MDKKEKPELTTEVLLADILLRLTVLEKLLFDNGTLSKEQYLLELEKIAIKASKDVLKKVENAKNVQEFIDKLNKDKN